MFEEGRRTSVFGVASAGPAAFIQQFDLERRVSRRLRRLYDRELRRSSCVSETPDALGEATEEVSSADFTDLTRTTRPDRCPISNSEFPQSFGYIVAGIFGAIIGSFLNVVIHRVPLEESIVFPNSRCPSCGAVIAFYDNIPVLSYLALAREVSRLQRAHLISLSRSRAAHRGVVCRRRLARWFERCAALRSDLRHPHCWRLSSSMPNT